MTCAVAPKYLTFLAVLWVILPSDFYELGAVNAEIFLEPYGVVAGIVPFNWPPLHAGAKIAPALAAGNTMVVKPGDQAPLAVMKIVEIVQSVLPENVLELVVGRVLKPDRF